MSKRGRANASTPSRPHSKQVQLSVPVAWVRIIDQAASLSNRTRSNFIALSAMKAAQALVDAAS